MSGIDLQALQKAAPRGDAKVAHLAMESFGILSRGDVFGAVSEICGDLIAAGVKPYFVGGCVRDAILGNELSDFDIEVFGMALDDIEKLLSGKFSIEKTGKSFCVLKIHGLPIDISVPRGETKFGDGHRDFHVNELKNCDVMTAASRRDFTINALYFDVARGEVVDKFGGVGDLKRGVLRHVGEKFTEDPLRVLRGMQFAGRFNLTAAEETIALCKKLSIRNLSRERIFFEWEKLILKAEKPSLGLRFLKAVGWLKFFPEIEKMDHCRQDRVKHPEGSVFEHTCMALDVFAGSRVGSVEEDIIVGLAVLCHDIGKPYVATRDARGIHHYGHGEAGVVPTIGFLKSINAPNYLVEAVVPLVRLHMVPRSLYWENRSKSAVLQLANDIGRIDRLIRLLHADLTGRTGCVRKSVYEAEEWMVATAKRLGVFENKPMPIIQGRDLIECGLQPSENFSKILGRCFTAQLNCEFADRPSGIAYLRKMIANNSQW
jgi:tRNA nucleotidyltransferase (CCA-adding enzyme)